MIELALLIAGVGLIVWGAEQFAEHLAAASARLGVSTFALAVLLAGAEPEELATAITAGVRDVPAVAFGDSSAPTPPSASSHSPSAPSSLPSPSPPRPAAMASSPSHQP